MPASQIDDQIIIQNSPWKTTFTIAAKSYHSKGPFIAELVGQDPEHDFKRLWLGGKDKHTCTATFDAGVLITHPKLLHIRAASSNYYLLYLDLNNNPVLYPIFSKTEVMQWLIAKQLWTAGAFGALIGASTTFSVLSTIHPSYIHFSTPAALTAALGGKPKKLPPAKLNIEPPAGKRRIKLG